MIWFNVEIEAAQTKTQKQLLNLVEYRQIEVCSNTNKLQKGFTQLRPCIYFIIKQDS